MFVDFFLKKTWLLIKMLFSYTSYQNIVFFFFFWQKYFYKIIIFLIVLSYIF